MSGKICPRPALRRSTNFPCSGEGIATKRFAYSIRYAGRTAHNFLIATMRKQDRAQYRPPGERIMLDCMAHMIVRTKTAAQSRILTAINTPLDCGLLRFMPFQRSCESIRRNRPGEIGNAKCNEDQCSVSCGRRVRDVRCGAIDGNARHRGEREGAVREVPYGAAGPQ